MHRLLRGNRGRPAKGAATIEQVRHRAMGSAGEGRSGRHLLASKALAWAERPPLWGSDDVSAMRNYRYRHRDSPCVAMRSGGTNIPGRATVGGRRRTSRSAVARKACVCARWSAVQGAVVAPTRGCRFFSSTSTLGCGAGRRRGGKADRSVQRPVRLVRCVGHGVGARGVGAVGLHARGGARGTGRAGQRGGVRRA